MMRASRRKRARTGHPRSALRTSRRSPEPCDGRLVRLIARWRQKNGGDRTRYCRLDKGTPYVYCLACGAVLRLPADPRRTTGRLPQHDDALCGDWARVCQEARW